MAAAVHELKPYPGHQPANERDPKEVVAVVLADGSVRDLRESSADTRDRERFASGRVAGAGWTLWWERRSFAPA